MDTKYKILILLTGISHVFGYEYLSKGQSATMSEFASCNPACGPNTAIDDARETCTRTEPIGKISNSKTTWWTVDLGGNRSIYSVRILFQEYTNKVMRQKGRFAGFSLYLSFTPIKSDGLLCYNNSLPLPPLDFNTTCIGYGRYVIYYNERLDSVKYPEGYQNPTNTQLCEVIVKGCASERVYGSNCDLPCPDKCLEKRCNIVNGKCLGCIPGWTGDKCKENCPRGWYGVGCKSKCTGHCTRNITCNHETGQCDGGCADGWMGRLCDEECYGGSYGPGCVHICSGHCLNNTYCNRETGHCNTGCNPGYSGDFCKMPCRHGFFGNNCNEQCNKGCKNERCDHTDGACIDGCSDGYIGLQCYNTCKEGYFGTNCSSDCPSRCNYSCHHTDGSCSGGIGKIEKVEAESTNTLSVGGVLGACVFVILFVILVVLFIRFRRRTLEKYSAGFGKTTFSSTALTSGSSLPISYNDVKSDHEQSVEEQTVDILETAKKGRPTNKTIILKNSKAVISKMSVVENVGFKHEYQEIPRGELYPCNEAKKLENKPKNRYTTTFPYDHSRVVLRKTHDGDYINANYIESVTGQRTYIATQGPKPKTIPDFWKMIWQEGVSIVVCLTNLKEGGKNKCAQYWPDINDKMQTRDVTLRHLEEKIYSNYTIRRFKAYCNLEQKDRDIVMFHYTRWPDHGVPDPLSLVVFHRHVMKISSETPGKYTLVHCSAGIGRTGTYIALDALYWEGERNGKVNVPMYVRTMRKDRMNMIQGDDQYKAVYLALCESFNGKSRCLTPETFLRKNQDKIYTNSGQVTTKSSSLSSEFQELLSLRKEYTEKDYESGQINISANYTESVLSVEKFLCYLSYAKGRNSYYNAVLLQSYTENDSVISAQYPLPNYTEDFLRLIKDFDARVVVFMCPLKDLKSTSLWLPTKSDHKTVGNFTIKLETSTNSASFASRTVVLKLEGGRSMKITVLECKTWKEGKMTIDKRALLELIKETKCEKAKHKEGRIVILSGDGATRCGTFCVVYNALEQLSMDQEVDIFTITRQLQIRRPEFVSTLDEYELSHEAVAEYIQNDSVYANC